MANSNSQHRSSPCLPVQPLLASGGSIVSVLLLCWGSYHWARNLWVLINYLFFPPCSVALSASKALHRLGSKSVSWCLETSLFLRLPFQDRAPSLVSFLVFYIFSYLFLKTMGCFSGCLMSSASIQKLFCGICSVFKYSFNEFVEEKVVSPSYSSTILGPPYYFLKIAFK